MLTPKQQQLLAKLQHSNPSFFKQFDLVIDKESPQYLTNLRVQQRVNEILTTIKQQAATPTTRTITPAEKPERKPWDKPDLSQIPKGTAPF